MPNDNVLTAEARATIMDACQSISRSADGLKAGCAIGDEWPDAEDKAFYDAELNLLERLTALLTHPGQPEPRAKVTDDDKRDAERYRWLRQQHWNESTLFVVAGHHSLVRLGTDCPSDERLDAAIDAASAGEGR
ncbi:hypothetical protein KEC55_07835 [Burkholderia cepacia]|uniref:hypothetical protein n=1 Tax=Burkholderia cepacia TaxID=292 RepID=UPI00249ED04F|nr:hypothetical protein [Burkholderia cepacia]WGY69866.1 hypothetical protein KEC55_07835 [Burkholderia cepacia]